MGQITNPIVKGITVNPIDRQTGPGAGAGATGNQVVALGGNAGNNAAISNAIFIGNAAGSGGITDVANLNGSTIIGVGSAPLLQVGVGTGLPLTLLGSKNLTQIGGTSGIDGTVIVGSDILDGPFGPAARLSGCVFVGNNLFQNPLMSVAGAATNAVVIGYRIGVGTVTPTTTSLSSAVLIGSDLFLTTNNNPYSGVVIGNDIDTFTGVGSTFGPNVIIGSAMTLSAGPVSSVIIGSGSYQGGAGAASANNVVVGFNANYNGSNHVLVGANTLAPNPVGGPGDSCVIIGSFAGTTVPTTAGFNNLLVIEAGPNSGAIKTLVYGQFLTGNMVVGNSVQGTNRDFGGVPGTNMLKLVNGTRATGAAIAGGGYFYVTGGVLHWVDSGGVDSQLSENVAGQLASSALVAYTNNAAAQAATMTNGPTAGNPTKWIPINDNGTIRNIPAW